MNIKKTILSFILLPNLFNLVPSSLSNNFLFNSTNFSKRIYQSYEIPDNLINKVKNTPTPTLIPKPKLTIKPSIKPTVVVLTQKPVPIPPSDVNTLIDKYAEEHHVDSNLMKRIAKCESNFHPDSTGGPYAGLYQFDKNTWISARTRMGLDTNPDLRLNAEEAIKTAAFKISNDGSHAWQNCVK